MASKTPVSFKITKDAKLGGIGITNGQIIFVEDTRKLYLDFHGNRVCYSGDEVAPIIPEPEIGTMVFKGIADADPLTSESFNLVGNNEAYVPKEGDTVSFGTKECIYRKDEEGNLKWFEIGDESKQVELTWDEDEEDGGESES